LSDFWAKKIAEQRRSSRHAHAQPPANRPAPAFTPWWQQPLSVPEPVQPPAENSAEGTTGEVHFNDVNASLRRAQSAKLDDRCPNCGSANYMSVTFTTTSGGGKSAPRCTDCNYAASAVVPSMGVGVPSSAVDGPVQAARQIATAPYQPGVISERA